MFFLLLLFSNSFVSADIIYRSDGFGGKVTIDNPCCNVTVESESPANKTSCLDYNQSWINLSAWINTSCGDNNLYKVNFTFGTNYSESINETDGFYWTNFSLGENLSCETNYTWNISILVNYTDCSWENYSFWFMTCACMPEEDCCSITIEEIDPVNSSGCYDYNLSYLNMSAWINKTNCVDPVLNWVNFSFNESYYNWSSPNEGFFSWNTTVSLSCETTYYWEITLCADYGCSQNYTKNFFYTCDCVEEETCCNVTVESESPANKTSCLDYNQSWINLSAWINTSCGDNNLYKVNFTFGTNYSESINETDGFYWTNFSLGENLSCETNYTWNISILVNYTDCSWENYSFWFNTCNCVGGESNVSWYSSGFGGKVTISNPGWGNWSDWWNITYANYTAPTSFTVSNFNSTILNLSWTSNPFADATSIVRKKGSSPSSHSDGVEVYNSTNSTFNDTGLDVGTHYFYKVWSWNDTVGYSTSNATGDDYTSPGDPSGLSSTIQGVDYINLSWSKGTNATNTVVRYNDSSYPSNPQSGTNGYNSTGTFVNITPLSESTSYYFRVWSYANGYFSDSYVQFLESTTGNLSAPSGFTATNYNNSRIDLSWTNNIYADSTLVRGKKESNPTSISDGFLVYNNTGESYSNTGLELGTPYYYKAWSWNTSEGFSSSNATDMAYTSPGDPSNLHNTSVGTNNVTLGWTNGTNSSRSVIRYNTGSYPSNPQSGSSGYNGTSNSTTINGLSSNTTYYFRLWSYINPFSESYDELTLTTLSAETPDPPYNASITYYTGGTINITWNRGNRSDEDVVVRKSSGYPSVWSDGTVMDRTNNSTGAAPPLYYHNDTVSQFYYYCIFSYNLSNSSYSIPCQVPLYGGLGLNCYNESNPNQALTFDILISNNDGTQTYQADGLTNTHWLNIEDIPYGDDIIFYVNSSGYKPRSYYYDIELGNFYNLTFYLPPLTTPSGGGGSGNGTCNLRLFTNAVSITNPSVNATVNLSHTIENLVSVSVYNVFYTIRTKTDSHSVIVPTVDVSIALTKTIDEIIGVYVYNDSLYGGWELVPDDKYSVNDTHCLVNNTVLDANSTTVKIDYYYLEVSYGTWVTVPDALFTVSASSVEIDDSALNSNTTMARVEYYYCYYEGETTETALYNIQVIELVETEYSSYNKPIENAKVWFRRYVNSTETYVNVSILKTDANGIVNLYLIPHTLYLVSINKSGYNDKISFYIPQPPNDYGMTETKIFRLILNTTTPTLPDTYDFWVNTVYTATMNSNNTIRIVFNDKLSMTTDSNINVYEFYNGSLTLKDSTSHGAVSSYSYYINGINTSRLHYSDLYLNSSAYYGDGFNTQPVRITILPISINTSFSRFDLESRIASIFGPGPLGPGSWCPFIITIIGLCILAGFGPVNVDAAIILSGFSMGIISIGFAVFLTNVFPVALTGVIGFIIVIGIIYKIAKQPGDVL